MELEWLACQAWGICLLCLTSFALGYCVEKSFQQMWQSRVEIEGYSVMYFNHIAALEVPYRSNSSKGGAHMGFIDLLEIHVSAKHVLTPPLTEVQRYGTPNTAMQLKYATE